MPAATITEFNLITEAEQLRVHFVVGSMAARGRERRASALRWPRAPTQDEYFTAVPLKRQICAIGPTFTRIDRGSTCAR